MDTTPFQLMTGRGPRTGFSVLAETIGTELSVTALGVCAERVQELAGWVDAQEAVFQDVLGCVCDYQRRKREAARRGELPEFAVGDYVLTARVRKLGSGD